MVRTWHRSARPQAISDVRNCVRPHHRQRSRSGLVPLPERPRQAASPQSLGGIRLIDSVWLALPPLARLPPVAEIGETPIRQIGPQVEVGAHWGGRWNSAFHERTSDSPQSIRKADRHGRYSASIDTLGMGICQARNWSQLSSSPVTAFLMPGNSTAPARLSLCHEFAAAA